MCDVYVPHAVRIKYIVFTLLYFALKSSASHLILQSFWVHFLIVTNSILIITFEENKASHLHH